MDWVGVKMQFSFLSANSVGHLLLTCQPITILQRDSKSDDFVLLDCWPKGKKKVP